ncbi:transcriptional regulator, partial [Fibrobacterota bacterium]
MDKWEKIVKLHRVLCKSRHCVSKTRLLKELECSEATFHRLRNFLITRLGAPLVFDKHYGGYRYDQKAGETYEIPGLWLSR